MEAVETRPEVPGYALLNVPPSRGRTARVYRAVSLADGAQAAVKVLTASMEQGDFLEEAFRRETQALAELSHPNIVRMTGSGITGAGDRFIVLDWVDSDLPSMKSAWGAFDWPSFWERIGRPIASAVAHAHSRDVAHRDLAPRNVLCAGDGTPLVADFGIAKLRRFLRTEQTLREFVSPPFTPPETDDGSGTMSRDVFSLASLFCWCASPRELSTYDEVALFAATSDALPPRIRDVLCCALARDPDERPATAEELLDRLDSVRLVDVPTTALGCQLSIGPAHVERVGVQFGLRDRSLIERAILDDLHAVCGIEPKPGLDGSAGTAFGDLVLYGLTRSYHVRPDELSGDRLAILNARERPTGWLEARREGTIAPRVEFRFSPRGLGADRRAVGDLQQLVDDYLRQRELEEAESGTSRVLDGWSRILQARQDLEVSRERPIRYSEFRVEGRRVEFRAAGTIPAGVDLEKRQVRLQDGTHLLGHVEEVDGDKVVFLVAQGDVELLRSHGEIVVNVYAASEALRKQQRALDAFRDGTVVRPRMAEVLLDPAHAAPVQAAAPDRYFQADLDPDKRAAVDAALGSPDVMLLRGPPGTGKTTFIAELVMQTLSADPAARILLCSQTNVAVDNAVERLAELRGGAGLQFEVVRLGTNDERISDSVEPHRLHRRLQAWTQEVSRAVEAYAERRADEAGLERRTVVIGMALERLLACQHGVVGLSERIEAEELQLERQGRARRSEGNIRLDLDLAGSVAARRLEISQFRERRKVVRDQIAAIKSELVGLDEPDLAGLDGGELEAAVDLYLEEARAVGDVRSIIELGADWIARFGRQDHFEAPFLSTVHVVAGTCLGVVGPRSAGDLKFDLCIVDEASKATATEMLVPLSRAARWVLVGDSKQLPPFQDEAMRDRELLRRYDLRREEVSESLFGYLERLLPASNVLSLTTQRRMIQPINDMIRACFYPDQQLDCARDGPEHRFAPTLKNAVTWLDTSGSARRGETIPRSGLGCMNRLECDLVNKRLKRLNAMFERRDSGGDRPKVSVAVITGYGEQLKLLERTINPGAASWTRIRILLNTVDAFQGRQADMVVYSVARSNDRRFLGFLRDLPRLNVALSRGRDVLLIVGDLEFCRGIGGENPFRDVIRWIEKADGCGVEEVA